MRRNLFVAPVDPERLDALPARVAYDALLCSVGYESRSRATAAALHGRVGQVMGVEFTHSHNSVYRENREFFLDHRFGVHRANDGDFLEWATTWFSSLLSSGTAHVAVDVSSMSRPRIASVVKVLLSVPAATALTIDFLYVPAEPTELPPIPDATEALEPVTAAFAGDPADPADPLMLLIGLGYESERAASAVDEFAPAATLPFVPVGKNNGLANAVKSANTPLLALEDVTQPIPYTVRDPFRCFVELEALIEHLITEGNRPLLLPLGPKIFATVCMLAAVTAPVRVPVWRVSSGAFNDPGDRIAESELVTLRVSTQPLEG